MESIKGAGCEILIPTEVRKEIRDVEKSITGKYKKTIWSMDPGYHPQIKELLLDNIHYLEIPLQIFDADIFNVVDNIARDYPCYMCARMRRGHLYAKARELGCNKLALGHHFNDVIETVMLNIIYGGTFKTMPPKLRSTNYPEIELIRPLYYIEEKFIKKWTNEMGIWQLICACME